MIILSERLMAVAKMAAPCGVIADIGCDHCLTLMWLIENGVCSRGIGVEIKEGPLEKAREGVTERGFTALIELRLGAGFEPLEVGEADAVVISGMGGLTVNGIIENGLRKALSASRLILQPQGHVPEVRRKLHILGFAIKSEKMITDNRKFYNIIEAVPDGGATPYENERDYAFGAELLRERSPVLKQYLENRLLKHTQILQNMAKERAGGRDSNTYEIEKYCEMLREALSCL